MHIPQPHNKERTMPDHEFRLPIQESEFIQHAEWIEQDCLARAEARREKKAAEMEAVFASESETYHSVRDNLNLPADPPDPSTLEEYARNDYEKKVEERRAYLAEIDAFPSSEGHLPPQTNSCVKRYRPYIYPFATPSSKATADKRKGDVTCRVSSTVSKYDSATAGMGYWFQAGRYISGYNAHADVFCWGSGALNGWFATSRFDVWATLRVYNANSNRTWEHYDWVDGKSMWFGSMLGAGVSGHRRISTYCQAKKGDWLFLKLIFDVDAVAQLGHASLNMTGELWQLQLCS